ncbi:MAG TPA: MFS transporter [Candidatus Krumholzibacteria bacterium]|nr:MFS transporter [Candidatus Krumholzibacteria bacterium]
MKKPAPTDRAMKAWAMYDWANSAFSTTVMAGFAPILFKEYWGAGADASETSFRLGLTNSLASLLIALMAPALGAVADAGGARKRFLLVATAISVIATAALATIGRGAWESASIVFGIGVVGFSACMIFYDALLMDVSTPETSDRVSARGFALGYLGGGVLFAVNVCMTLKPHWFGLPDATAAARVSFLTVALWWALFSIPLFRHVHETNERAAASRGLATIRAGFSQLAETFGHLRRHREAFLFLIGYWLYIDGVSTIVRMAVDYGISLGFPSSALIGALLLTQFVGFPASIWFGRIGERFGARTGIFIAIAVYIGICLWGYRLAHVWEFYALATAIGLVQGGINSLSRSLFSRLSPHERSAQFFGFYNTVGRFSAVLGPVLMGAVSKRTGNPRLSMLALTVLFIAGAMFLARVREKPLSSAQPHAQAP